MDDHRPRARTGRLDLLTTLALSRTAEEDRMVLALLVGMLRESERRTLGLMAALRNSKRLAYCLYNQTTAVCAHNQLKRGMRRCNLRTLQGDSRKHQGRQVIWNAASRV
jgi:hypothetical protein